MPKLPVVPGDIMSDQNDDSWFTYSADIEQHEYYDDEHVLHIEDQRLTITIVDAMSGGYGYADCSIIRTRAQFDRYIKYLYELAEKARFDD